MVQELGGAQELGRRRPPLGGGGRAATARATACGRPHRRRRPQAAAACLERPPPLAAAYSGRLRPGRWPPRESSGRRIAEARPLPFEPAAVAAAACAKGGRRLCSRE